jgi:hypothetical protein
LQLWLPQPQAEAAFPAAAFYLAMSTAKRSRCRLDPEQKWAIIKKYDEGNMSHEEVAQWFNDLPSSKAAGYKTARTSVRDFLKDPCC